MIVSLTRDGVVASVSVTRNRSAMLMNQPSRILLRSFTEHGVTSKRSNHRPARWTQANAVYNGRWYSTSLPPEKAATASSAPAAPPVPPVTPGPPRPRKVDLRPGPIKPPAASASAPAGPSRQSSATESERPAAIEATSSSVRSSDLHANGPQSKEHPPTGLLSATQQDIDAAAQHGILAPPPENAGKIRKLVHQAIELFKFYLRGFKLINTNRKRVNEMHERVRSGGPPLTRWEHRFIRTHKQDVIKLIPFAMIIVIIEEILPLVVLYAPFILPSTCILPSQQERIDTKRRDKQRTYATTMKDTFESIRNLGETTPGVDAKQLLDGPGLVAMSGILGHSSYSFNALRMRRVTKHLSAVAEDDARLLHEENGKHLTPAEITEALGERGIVVEGLTPQEQKSRLIWWLQHVAPASKGLQDAGEQLDDPIARRMILIARNTIGRY